MVTKEDLSRKFVAEDVIKNKIITVAGQKFIEYEKELNKSNQIVKGYEDSKCDNKIKNDRLDKFGGDNVKDMCSEKGEVLKKFSIIRFIKIFKNNRREILSSKQLLRKKVSMMFH